MRGRSSKPSPDYAASSPFSSSRTGSRPSARPMQFTSWPADASSRAAHGWSSPRVTERSRRSGVRRDSPPMPWSDTLVVPGTPVRQRSSTTRIAAAMAYVILTGWVIAIALHASVVVNGSRVFYLDDVQMVGMRYGRNLAEGLGLVWNAGERVEGYTNLLWTLFMALIHLTPLSDSKTSLVVLLANLGIAAATVPLIA